MSKSRSCADAGIGERHCEKTLQHLDDNGVTDITTVYCGMYDDLHDLSKLDIFATVTD